MIVSLPQYSSKKVIEQTLKVLRNDGVIVYPTDTHYGLGCALNSKKALAKIYALKNIPHGKPLTFVCSDLSHLSEFALVSNYAYKIMRRIFPGPYTIILPASKLVPKLMLSKRAEVGIRIPNHDFVLEITKELGIPLVSTSVHLYEEFEEEQVRKARLASPEDPLEIESRLGKKVDLVIDAGLIFGKQSTVVSLVGDEPVLIRQGVGDSSFFNFK